MLQRISDPADELLSKINQDSDVAAAHAIKLPGLTTHIENGFQSNLKTGAVFLDLTAAYDTVWHTGLLYKLTKCMEPL